MGSCMSRSVREFMTRNERRILLLGLDGAGKTTLVTRLMGHDATQTAPTSTLSIEDVRAEGLRFSFWDVGGADRLRPYWRHHFTGSQGVVVVVDAADRGRLATASAEVRHVLADPQLADIPVAVVANKQDVPGALTADELRRELDLDAIGAAHPRTWRVFATSSRDGTGLAEVTRFLAEFTRPL